MKKNQDHPADTELRRRAEERLGKKQRSQRTADSGQRTAEETARLVHELQVHQIELEMQNEELQQTRATVETLLAQYTDLYDFAPAGYLTLDRAGAIRQVNLTGARLLGVERSGLVNRRFGPFIGEADRCAFRDFLEKVFAGQTQESCEVTLPRKGAQPLVVRIEGTRSADEQECRAVVLDITERKQMEEEKARLEAQLHQAQKMEAVGRLAGGVAHDFNNLLMGIMGYAEICRDRIEPDHPIREWLDEITRDAQRSAEITRKLLAFARKQIIVPRVLDLNDAVAGMLRLLRRLVGEDITLTWRPDADLRPVRLDPSQVDQILANLCLNARDAIAGVGEIALETGNITVDAASCARHPEAIPGAYVVLAVSDNGCGMDKELLAQVFEPFFTTKGIGQGTGLGLATVYGIVKQNSGFIHADSEPGKGTTFRIYLPQVAAEAMETPVPGAAEAPKGRGETILLVEDEKSLRVTCGLFLGALGYKVLVAETPEEALQVADRHPGAIHLLLTDVVMPGMDGLQLATRLRAVKSGLRVLFMSGYTADVIGQRGVLDEGVQFLAKPFSRDDLARKVREVLGGDRQPEHPLTGQQTST